MRSNEIRDAFLDFFKSKQHKIVPSAPMVMKDDPTLMFTNAGMNQFKELFLGNAPVKYHRVADTQKCLRVSGKHNDLEEVGHDTYHHTMFEMLGNWSFGDYFKKEAIEWAWEFLTGLMKINKENLYVTIFGGDDQDGLPVDQEAYDCWKAIVPEDRILNGCKKDNFWEMGETGPCGPCSEIHIDLRSDEEKARIPGHELVNMDHPEVIEIWNLVFIQFNRNSEGSLLQLPAKHVDTGMGFERLCMALQGKKSNYDTDIFQPLIKELEKLSGHNYGENTETDIAMRVCADHVRAVAFSIADGQLPSNTGAGYVIRRILRRAVRYGYTFLGFKEPFLNKLLPLMVEQMSYVFPELAAQQDIIRKVITEEELSFLRTLEHGIRLFDEYISRDTDSKVKVIKGSFAFELYDTYGFPIDLTQLMAREKGWDVDMKGFYKGLEQQKERSRKAAEVDAGDWIILKPSQEETVFVGYNNLLVETGITQYRKVTAKKKSFFEIVLKETPFYAESGGQVGDKGYLQSNNKRIPVLDTKNEHNLIVHVCQELPEDPKAPVIAAVNEYKRELTANNHSATHLLHAALKSVLGSHVEQKGSLVDPDRLRFDFSHFAKMTEEEIDQVEKLVNKKIRENIPIGEFNEVPFEEAKKMGAMALFGEKYGDHVRVITFDKNYSIELCGGTHVDATGRIGLFKIVSESAIAAGIRRIEAITAETAEDFVNAELGKLKEVRSILKGPKDVVGSTRKLIEEVSILQKQIDAYRKDKVKDVVSRLKNEIEVIGDVNFIACKLDLDMNEARDLAFKLSKEVDKLFLLIGTTAGDKCNLTLMISENLVKDRGLNAGTIIREIARSIKGGGGGQPHFATAGGKDAKGMEDAFIQAKKLIQA